MTPTFVSNRGCCGGGAARVTTDRVVATAGGRGAAACCAPIRIEARVGITGMGPLSTGADSTERITERSRT
jgi:hypothetical protein